MTTDRTQDMLDLESRALKRSLHIQSALPSSYHSSFTAPMPATSYFDRSYVSQVEHLLRGLDQTHRDCLIDRINKLSVRQQSGVWLNQKLPDDS